MKNTFKAALMVTFSSFFLAGCGNANDTTNNGQTAVGRTSSGKIIVVVQACTGSVNEISVNGSREGLTDKQTNPNLGDFKASKDLSGQISLNLTSVTPPWKEVVPLSPPKAPTTLWIFQGFNSDKKTETTAVQLKPSQIEKIKPEELMINTGEIVQKSKLKSISCPNN